MRCLVRSCFLPFTLAWRSTAAAPTAQQCGVSHALTHSHRSQPAMNPTINPTQSTQPNQPNPINPTLSLLSPSIIRMHVLIYHRQSSPVDAVHRYGLVMSSKAPMNKYEALATVMLAGIALCMLAAAGATKFVIEWVTNCRMTTLPHCCCDLTLAWGASSV